MANTDLLGYAKAIHIIAIIECVLYCLSIVGLIFLYFPIIGMRICKKWDVSEAKCVGLDWLMSSQYYIWHLIGFIFSCLSLAFGFLQVDTLLVSILSVLLEGWIFYVSKRAYELLRQNVDTPEVLTQEYLNAPCKCI